MNLIIVESPTKARTLSRFLGKEYLVDATMGHVRDLPKSTLGIDIEHDFAPEYVLVPKKKEIVARIKKESKTADHIYLATDPDREGEAIAYHVAELLKQKTERIAFHEITESAVRHAIENAGNINIPLVNAQQARRVLDRLVGYKLSPLLWRKVRRGLSAGRVQSVAVRLIVEREQEIEGFKSEEYWEIYAEVTTDNKKEITKGKRFVVQLVRIGDQKAEVKNKDQAEKIVSDLEKADYFVDSVEQKQVKRSPWAPFTTSTLAQTANRRFGWTARRTMSVAQRLYEEGLITYHRTDSLNLAKEAVAKVRKFIENAYGASYIPPSPRLFKTKSKLAQEAHEAIRPTGIEHSTKYIEQKVDKDGQKLYELIWKRFVACQMADAILEETTIDVEAKSSKLKAIRYFLRAKGEVMKFEGWRKIYGGKEQATNDKLEEQELPGVNQGEPLQLIKVDPQQKFTQPPARYTEASLVKTLEKLGIGRPSTYAPIIFTIQSRQYVEKDEGKFKPTSVGIAVNDFLVKWFGNIVNFAFTAEMENDLDKIASDEKKWVPVIGAFWQPFFKKIEEVTQKAKRVAVRTEKTGKKCPLCKDGDQVIRVGRFGKFLSCSRFPDCKYSAPFVEKINMKCQECGQGDVIIRKTRRGRKFYGCSRYPACKFASWKNPALEKRQK